MPPLEERKYQHYAYSNNASWEVVQHCENDRLSSYNTPKQSKKKKKKQTLKQF